MEISDPVVPGTVEIHKNGINGTDLPGATFTLYVNNAPLATRGAEDTITTKTCTTNASGDCTHLARHARQLLGSGDDHARRLRHRA